MSADRPFILFAEYRSAGWTGPDRWAIGKWSRETAQCWFGRQAGYRYDRRRDPERPWSPERRRPLELIVGRYATLEEAEATRETVCAIQREIQGRRDAIVAERALAMQPFTSRLAQLGAEEHDALTIITGGGRP